MYQQIVRLVGDIRALAVQNRMWASDHYEGDRGLERGEYVKIVKRNVKKSDTGGRKRGGTEAEGRCCRPGAVYYTINTQT